MSSAKKVLILCFKSSQKIRMFQLYCYIWIQNKFALVKNMNFLNNEYKSTISKTKKNPYNLKQTLVWATIRTVGVLQSLRGGRDKIDFVN
jgi:hypothetical protein